MISFTAALLIYSSSTRYVDDSLNDVELFRDAGSDICVTASELEGEYNVLSWYFGYKPSFPQYSLNSYPFSLFPDRSRYQDGDSEESETQERRVTVTGVSVLLRTIFHNNILISDIEECVILYKISVLCVSTYSITVG